MSLRVKYRKNLNIDPNLILYNLIKDNVKDYSNLYHSLGNFFYKNFEINKYSVNTPMESGV